jgi:hypothetical protein
MLIKQWLEHDAHGKIILCTGYFLFGFVPIVIRKEYL